MVLDRAFENPQSIAIEDGRQRLTYADLDRASAAVARALLAVGVEPEEPVAVCMPRSWQAICGFLGAMRAGAAYLPLNPAYPELRKRSMLELAGVRTGLSSAGHGQGLPSEVNWLDASRPDELPSSEEAPPPAPGGDRLAYVLFTSGSTGVPKGVEITHANLAHVFGSGSDLVPLATDAVLAVAPIEFDIAAFETWGALTAGGRLVLAPPHRPDPRALARLIAAREVSFAFFAAGLFEQVVRAGDGDLGGMRLIAAGGDVMSPAAARALRAAHPGVRLLNAYGPTETSIVASFHEVDAVDGSPLPIGSPLPGYAFHVLGEDGTPVAPGDSGELWIGGPGVGRGYRGDPERSADRFRADPFAGDGMRMYGSGDIVRRRPDGEYQFLGRSDDQVKIAGHRVEPGEVEQALGTHPEVSHAAVVAREDVAGHKRLVGYAALRDGAAASADDLRDYLADRLPHYMVPATVQTLAELPLTGRGKVDRAALPAPERTAPTAAADALTQRLAELMGELLDVEEVGPDEDFFALGADSLLALQLVGRLRSRLDSGLDINAVFEAPTPRRLAAALGAERPAAAARPQPRRQSAPGPAPASFAQRRAWLFERTNPGSLAFQFACVIHLRGRLDEAALAGALGDLLQRHEVLRTALVERDGEPVQVVAEDVPVPLEIVDLPGPTGSDWARLVRERVRTRIDTGRAPMVRWTLVRLGEERAALIDVEHHAVHDGWSFTIVLAELAELYSARVEGRAPALPVAEIEFGDFARWERELAETELATSQLDYWRRTLDPNPPLLELPLDRPRPRRESFSGSSVRRRFDPALAAAVRELAREEGATSFMVCLAAFATLLGRYGESTDVQIGSGLANRRDPLAEQLVGMTVGTVALRIDLGGDPSVRELLRRTKKAVLGAIANADVPFERVVEELAPNRQPGRSPLVQAMFSFDDAPLASAAWSGLEVEVVQTVPNGTAKADLNVIGVDHGDGSPFFIWEHSDLFSDATADRLAGQHLQLLAQFAAAPEGRLSQLEPQGDEERSRLEAWRAGERHEAGASLTDLVLRQAQLHPDATAVLADDGRLTYRELVDRAAAVAALLAARGVERGEAVAVLLPRSGRAVVAQLGVLMAGGCYLPLDPSHPRPRMERALADAGARLVLSDPGEELPAGVEAVDAAAAGSGGGAEPPPLGPDEIAYLMYTSGSTGEPKGVEVTHGNVVRLVDDPDFAELGPGTVMLHAASPAFDATTLEVWGPLANGGTVVALAEQPSPDSIAAAIDAHGVNTAWLTAGLFHELVERRPQCLAGLRHLLAGGDVLSAEHVRKALRALPPGARLTNGYGPTETTTFALTHDLRPGDPVPDSVPLGRPIQGTTCDVLDRDGRPRPVGAAGELWVGGDGVARGYRNDERLTAERFVPDPHRPGRRRYRSGDRVRRLADGTIEFLGRLDRQLKVRGVRVEPAEIEAALRTQAGVADVAVVPYERAAGEEALAAYVVAAGAEPPAPGILREHAKRLLPAAMVPSAWVSVPRLPLTANGKLDRERLPRPGREHLAASGGGGAPANALERRVVAAFEAVLEISPVGVEDDFFALGGHSLLAVSLFEKLERISGRRLPLATVFEESTPRGLARCLGHNAPHSHWDNLVPLKPQGSAPPLFVVSAGDGNLVGFAPLARHLSPQQPLYGLQPSGLDGRRALDRGIAEMADRYVREIRRVRPHGPYLLAGRCNGATVAYEVAQRLRAGGEEVPLLVSLDSDPPPAGPTELEPGVPYDAMMEVAAVRARDRGEDVPDPDGPDGPRALARWLREPAGPRISRYLHEAWHWRWDLRENWPEPLGANAPALAEWAWEHGIDEMGLAPELLLPAPADSCRLPDGRAWDWAMALAWDERGLEPADVLSAEGWAELRAQLQAELGDGINGYLLAASRRPDLAELWPNPLNGDGQGLLDWAWSAGLAEGLSPDLLPPSPTPLSPRQRRALRARAAGRRLTRARKSVSRRAAKAGEEGWARTLEAVERRLDRPLPGARERVERRVIAAARRARAAYRAQPWPGKIVLVTSAEFVDKPPYLAWPSRALDGLERRHLDVGHIEMLREPDAALLAACLEECIAEAAAT